MNKIFFVTGASGAGKTTIIKKLESSGEGNFHFCYFDSIGVPSNEEMIRDYKSSEEWQRITTQKWVKKILDSYIEEKHTILDGQTRPIFIDEACSKYGVTKYKIILFDCSDEVRKQRLIERGSPELANDQMMNWAKYLREQSKKYRCEIIDTTNMSQDASMKKLSKSTSGVK